MDDLQQRFLFQPAERRYTIREITREIADLLAVEFTGIWVEGEISDVKASRQGHFYFSLRDGDATLPCVCFRGAARMLRFLPEEGIAVSARGRIGVYEARGQYQFLVEALEPRGLGALQLAFEQLKAKLAAEGLFSPQRKRSLPHLPRRIGIVTSPTGAAIQDILQILSRRCPGLSVRIYPSLVQGEGAPEQIADGLRWFTENPWAEVVIVGRGGGSLEDLWSFNTEVVARAIAACAVPVVSAVGHETDFTIADFVADLRAPTPSAAAELVVPNRDDLLASVDSLARRLKQGQDFALLRKRRRLESVATQRAETLVHRRLTSGAQRLDDLDFRLRDASRANLTKTGKQLEANTARLAGLDLRVNLAQFRARIEERERNLREMAGRTLSEAQHRADLLRSRLASLSPVGILSRGYALVRTNDGGLVRDSSSLAAGMPVSMRFARGEAEAVVSRVVPGAGPR
ncbi:MAG: exodeoxyribonuclease VII large subunit [Bryobacterales bacterium]|nr:exodeoxyribonuclease VII large subunit [Bryobacterales bacterium]